MGHPVLTVGHRGCRVSDITENSINAFEKAIQAGYSMIELDVFVCKSGELVVMHDETLERTTTSRGCVEKMTLEELKKVKLKDGQSIPTLREVFDHIDRRCRINVELKGRHTEQPAVELVQEYVATKGWSYDDFLLSTFDHYQLKYVKNADPGIPIGALLDGILIGYAEFGQQLGAYSVNINANRIIPELVEDAHKRGMKIFAWTVNSKRLAEKLIEMGVDGLYTDKPNLYELTDATDCID